VKRDAVGMIGLLADIHANHEALQVALEELAGAGTDRYIVAGDVIGYGPHPNECVAAVSQLPGLVAVAGNHELLVRGSLADTALPEMVRRSIAWTKAQLNADSAAFLAALPDAAQLDGISITHGAIGHPAGYVSYGHQARAQLRLLGDQEPNAGILVLGHTHLQWVYHEQRGTRLFTPSTWIDLDRSARQLVNPGAVGQSRVRERTPKARFAQLDPISWRVRFWQAEYDHLATRRALRASGQPEELVHHPPTLLATAVRPLRAHLSRLRHGDIPA
jgi:predicted phosphodiesterase